MLRANATLWQSQFGCTVASCVVCNDAIVKVDVSAAVVMHGGAMSCCSERCHSEMAAMQGDAKVDSTNSHQSALVRCAMFENGCSKSRK